jgi:hypothetical protein
MRTYAAHPLRYTTCNCDDPQHVQHVEIVSTRSKKIMAWGVYYHLNGAEETWIADCPNKKDAERVRAALTLYEMLKSGDIRVART